MGVGEKPRHVAPCPRANGDTVDRHEGYQSRSPSPIERPVALAAHNSNYMKQSEQQTRMTTIHMPTATVAIATQEEEEEEDENEDGEELNVGGPVEDGCDARVCSVGGQTSIGVGVVAVCASTASGCSRVSDAPASAPHQQQQQITSSISPNLGPNNNSESETSESAPPPDILDTIRSLEAHTQPYTQSDFSLEFIQTIRQLKDDTARDEVLSSKNLNRRTEGRLKNLELKLLKAGIVDAKKQVVDKDANENLLICEFDPKCFPQQLDYSDFIYYDELEMNNNNCSNGNSSSNNNMGTDSERKQHNPDRNKLRSLLKEPGPSTKLQTNRVVFNEDKNEFFDADYIILIREDCDYDEEEDDGVCTCNQHEMVRLTCCEQNCNCGGPYDSGYEQTPQSPKFAPPLEFVDAVTLSPPEGYKDMELGEQQLLALQQITRRGQIPTATAVCKECSLEHDEDGGSEDEQISDQEIERAKMDQSQQTTPTTPPVEPETRVAMPAKIPERRQRKEMLEDERKESSPSPTPSLQPGGSPISGILKGGRLWKQQPADVNNMRSEFLHQQQQLQQQVYDNITSDDEGGSKRSVRFIEEEEKRDLCEKPLKKMVESKDEVDSNVPTASPESTEMTLTFKLGNHVLISNNSLKPNSAVRQLFPCTKPLAGKQDEGESVHQYLVTAESLKAFEEAKRSKLPQIIGEADESIKRAIERNTLRRSLIRYEPRSKKNTKTDNSLVERIKQLTCDVDEPLENQQEKARASPPGEEARNSPEISAVKNSPSSSSSSTSSVSSTYRKITDLFAKRDRPDIQIETQVNNKQLNTGVPDLGGPQETHNTVIKVNSTESRKQFLSTLAPLTACVGGAVAADDYYYHMNTQGDRMSMASSVGTEYSLEDIEDGLKKDEEESKRIAPDVLVGTPSASESGDELAMFVQQDASRIERIKKKYQPDAEEDDEHDDYGFNRRPSVRGIKPRFGSTTEILQQIQNQMQPPTSTPPRNPPVAWPYYSETNLSGVDNKIRAQPPTYQYVSEEIKRTYAQYRPTTLVDENIYQNCANRCPQQGTYRTNIYTTRVAAPPDYYQSLPRNATRRPQSPPPQEVSKGYHQTMVYIPYNHIEPYQPYYPAYTQNYQVRQQHQQQLQYAPRSDSPQQQFARSTQTYYPRYRPPNGYQQINRHSYPRYPPDNCSIADSETYMKDSMPNSPTKPRFIERGVPEGAASVSPQDSNVAATMTSPTSPQNPTKPMFYAMNV
ncbi:PREDICTED: uncharacterized protein LOC108561078 isoform X2 [Nicrophorus vespilloides]|uniref:Uncharacterized protein LOC108561078 isoform X2 n=1 Tax=Nicrophorus vespilloides TaxID=110193 RepID=A0ABM1MIF5_NICVS|nr:PREDICTED: uncharacterized protein LOC108561078 isoform X2 [Nicrophorus vespilloides]